VAAGQLLLLVRALCALGERLDVDGHGLLHLVHALMTQVHLHLECLELVGEAGTGFGAHLFVCPLLEAIEFLGDIHICVCIFVCGWVCLSVWVWRPERPEQVE